MTRVPGVHLLHKPRGVSSASVLRGYVGSQPLSARKAPKAMHGGTLDPFADGLLLGLVGQAVHLFEPLHALPKVYEADLAWGVETDNGDPTGQVIARAGTEHLTADAIETHARALLGWQPQVPPATSAKKIGGEPAYRKVHRGEVVTLPPSQVYLHEVSFLSHALPDRSRVRLVCRGGFYVRAFARDLAASLGTVAHLASLRRTQIGPWRDPGEGTAAPPVTGPAALPDAARRQLTDAELGELRRGRPIPTARMLPPPWTPPRGFPPRAPELICGVHRERLTALLTVDAGALVLQRELRGGI